MVAVVYPSATHTKTGYSTVIGKLFKGYVMVVSRLFILLVRTLRLAIQRGWGSYLIVISNVIILLFIILTVAL